MKKFISPKLQMYIRFYLKRIKKIIVFSIIYYFTLFFTHNPSLLLAIFFVQMILVLLILYYLLTTFWGIVGDILREIKHGGRYMSVLPDEKEILLTEIWREIVDSKRSSKARKIEEVYMGELKAEDIKK